MSGEPQDSPLRDDLVAAIPECARSRSQLCGNRDRADDLEQEALVKAWNRLQCLRAGHKPQGLAVYHPAPAFFSELRKMKREVADSDGELAARLSVPPDSKGILSSWTSTTRSHACLADQREEALILVGAEGFSYKERRPFWVRGRHRQKPGQPCARQGC